MRACQGATVSLPCTQVVWNGSGLCEYHEKIRDGFLEPSSGPSAPPGWRPAAPPKLALSGDGWLMASVTALDPLLSWSNEEITELDLALDRGRQVARDLAARQGPKRGQAGDGVRHPASG